ncbi:MAG: MCE family protein [Leptospira sp.]|nr:MCE family protein [Leptospira sp.]NCS92834.1 MCE family protein [Leptospira sp.]
MKKETIAALLFLGALSYAFFYTIISVDSKTNLHPYRSKIYYSKIDGILEGSEVYVKGIEKGYVYSIDIVDLIDVPDKRFLDKDAQKAIELTLALKEPLTLWDNYKIKLKTKTLFSGRVIDIDPGNFENKNTAIYNPFYLETERTPDFFPSASFIDNFFEAANTVIVENKNDVHTIAINSREISDKLNSDNGTLPKIINTNEMYDTLYLTLNDLSILSKEARRYTEANRKLENTHPIPFFISSSFFGSYTLTGRYVEPITDIQKFP